MSFPFGFSWSNRKGGGQAHIRYIPGLSGMMGASNSCSPTYRQLSLWSSSCGICFHKIESLCHPYFIWELCVRRSTLVNTNRQSDSTHYPVVCSKVIAASHPNWCTIPFHVGASREYGISGELPCVSMCRPLVSWKCVLFLEVCIHALVNKRLKRWDWDFTLVG